MQLGMIGLGRMGGNIVRRLMKNGHRTVVYDKDPKAVATLAADGAVGASALEDFVSKLGKPRLAHALVGFQPHQRFALGQGQTQLARALLEAQHVAAAQVFQQKTKITLWIHRCILNKGQRPAVD